MFGATPEDKAYFAPFLAFVALLLLGQMAGKVFEGEQVSWPLAQPQYWVNPAQTLLCGALLFAWRRRYGLSAPTRPWESLGIGLLVLLLWIAPQEILGFSRRDQGFDPYFFGGAGPAYWANLGLRMARLAVVVPLVEEIFWRGFVLRFVIDANFTRVPFGTFRWDSFLIVTAGFTLEHNLPDWPAAALAGALYNLVAYRTRSLSACVLAHAATNLLLGFYVLRTGQWGFW
jgi:uncharacterized protein